MIIWDPSVVAFSLGGIVVRWYSLLWCIGLFAAWFVVQRLYRHQCIADEKFEPLFLYCFLGVLIGARLGHCLLYEPAYFLAHPLEMILPMRHDAAGGWHFTGYAGLASHGGTLGLMLALWLYVRRYKVGLLRVLDCVAIATPATACCIRLGNLMNSEIVGKACSADWPLGFVFQRLGETFPRHPGQLYEAMAYLVFFVVGLLIYRRQSHRVGTGFYFGLCLTSIFTFRFFVEFFKEVQEPWEVAMQSAIGLNQGQLLSLPFVAIGLYCLMGGRLLRRLMAFGVLLLCTGCGPAKDKVRISVNIDGVERTNLLLYATESAGRAALDTLKIEGSEGRIECSLDQPTLLTLLFPNFTTLVLVARPGDDIAVQCASSRLAEAAVTGNDDNDLLTTLRQRIAPMRQADREREVATFVRSHAETMAAVAAFVQYFAAAVPLRAEPTRSLLTALQRAQPDDAVLRAVSDRLTPLLASAEGARLPHFSGTTLSGDSFDSKGIRGRRSALVVWASWADRSYALLRAVGECLAAQPSLSVVTVSFDTEKEKAEHLLSNAMLRGVPTLCDTKGIDSPLYRTLGVTALPAVIIVDKAGTVERVVYDTAELKKYL